MSINREHLDAGQIDFAEVTTGKKLPPVHPGEILRDDFLERMKISVRKGCGARQRTPARCVYRLCREMGLQLRKLRVLT